MNVTSNCLLDAKAEAKVDNKILSHQDLTYSASGKTNS